MRGVLRRRAGAQGRGRPHHLQADDGGAAAAGHAQLRVQQRRRAGAGLDRGRALRSGHPPLHAGRVGHAGQPACARRHLERGVPLSYQQTLAAPSFPGLLLACIACIWSLQASACMARRPYCMYKAVPCRLPLHSSPVLQMLHIISRLPGACACHVAEVRRITRTATSAACARMQPPR